MQLIYMFMGVLAQILPSLIGRVLLALGISFVTYTGMSVAIDGLYASAQSSFSGLPAETLNLLAYLWVDKALSVVFSAFTAALAIKTLKTGSITKMVTK